MSATIAPATLRMLVGGQWRDAAGGARLDSVDPATEQVIASVPDATGDDVGLAVEAAGEAAAGWADLGWPRRAALLRELGRRITEQAEELARIDVADSGNPISGMRADVVSAVAEIDYFAGLAPETKGTTLPGGADQLTYTVREPYGVVGRIIPFNHPFKFAAGKVAAPLAAGNAVVLKPAEHTSMSALRLAALAADVLPPGVLNVVTGRGGTAGAALAAHPDVPRLAFTGSVPTGTRILHAAAARIAHVTLELGGKNPIVVFDDVDPVRAARAAVAGMNIARCNGQSCGSTSRLYVHERIWGRFLDALLARVAELRIGDPADEDTEVGPLAFGDHYRRVLGYIETARAEGATVACGGGRPAGVDRGFFVAPTVLTGLDDAMTVVREEVFGPVLAVLSWRNVDDVMRRANATRYGLTANVWTSDVSTAHRTAGALQAGTVFVNGTGRRPLGSPFGGWKSSGLGKENALEELLSYTREKSVVVSL
jgi:betaine-aldehyde dehydrogenase